MIEQHTGTEISIYKSTVVLVGEGSGLISARQAIEMLASGSEHGTVIKYLEKERRKLRMEARSLDYIVTKDVSEDAKVVFCSLKICLYATHVISVNFLNVC